MTALRPIDPKPFVELAGALPVLDAGQAPQLRWIEIEQLAIDPSYQREIFRSGKKNIVRIAREFEWAKFAPVIVAPLSADRFVIVDGQHRTLGAALRGIKKVPCQIITADQRKQAASFAAINANVTEMSPMQVHTAKIAAADPDALRLNKICAAGGVSICRYPVGLNKMKVGETTAVVQIRRALERWGEATLRASLKVITGTGDGHAGFVRGQLVQALCSAFEAAPEWPKRADLIERFQKFDFRAAWNQAAKEALMSRGKIISVLTGMISAHLDRCPASPSKPLAAARPAAVAAPASIASMNGATVYNGVGVDLVGGRIEFAHRAIKFAPREALLIALLARAMPTPVTHDFLRERVWAKTHKPVDAHDVLDHMARSCAPSLASIGLEIKITKGVGIGLRVAE